MDRKNIFLFAGGSGGHVNPALVLKKDLESQGHKVVLFVSNFSHFKSESRIKGFKMSRLKPLVLIQYFYIFNYLLVLFILKRIDIAIGFGGSYSLVGMMVAKILRRKTFIYEPNMTLGRANRVLAYFVDRILVLWSEISLKPDLESKIKRIRPLIRRGGSLAAKDKRESFSVLFAGGSSGSMFLNNLFTTIIQGGFLKDQKLRLVLITGDKFYWKVKERIGSLNINNNIDIEVYSFCDDMEVFINKFDFLISRAGAQIIVESIFSELPTLYIPYPYAGEHQLDNARNILDKKACFLIKQELARAEVITSFVKYLEKDRDVLSQIRIRLAQLKNNFKIVDRAIDIILR